MQIKRHSWNEDQIEPVCRERRTSLVRLANTEMAFHYVTRDVFDPARNVSSSLSHVTGQGGYLAAPERFVQHRPKIQLQRKWRIEENGLGLLPGRLGKQEFPGLG